MVKLINESIGFKLGNSLKEDIVFRQDVGLVKAIMECVANSIDEYRLNGKIKKVEVCVTSSTVTVTDFGNGISTLDELKAKVGTYGDSVKRDDNLTIGHFGLGIAQMFAKGICTIRTQQFVMVVDARKDCKNFCLSTTEDKFKGFTIECRLYNELSSVEVNDVIYQLKNKISYPQLIINGKKAVEDKLVFRYETEHFKIEYAKKIGKTKFFNLEFFIKEFDDLIKARIYTKHPVQLNIQRNDFADKTENENMLKEVYSFFASVIANNGRKLASAGIKLMEICPEIVSNLEDVPIVKDTRGKAYTIRELRNMYIVGLASNERLAGRVREKTGIIQLSVDDMSWRVINVLKANNIDLMRTEDIAVKFHIHEKKRIFRESDLTSKQKKNLRRMELMCYLLTKDRDMSYRKIHIGSSNTAMAWTDGKRYIVFRGSLFKSNAFNFHFEGYHILCHELAHDGEDEYNDAHDYDFSSRYRRLTENSLWVAKKVASLSDKQVLSELANFDDRFAEYREEKKESKPKPKRFGGLEHSICETCAKRHGICSICGTHYPNGILITCKGKEFVKEKLERT